MLFHFAPVFLVATLAADNASVKLPEPTDRAAFQHVLTSADRHAASVLSSVEDLLPRATEVSAFLRNLEAKERFAAVERKTLQDVYNRFPVLSITGVHKGKLAIEGLLTDPAELQKRLRTASNALGSARLCIEELRRETTPHKDHCGYLLRCPEDVGSDEHGLYRLHIEEGYALRSERITMSSNIFTHDDSQGTSSSFSTFQAELAGLAFDQCRLLSLLTPSFEPDSPNLTWRHFPRFGFDSPAEFGAACSSDPTEHPVYRTLQQLATRFPNSEEIAEALREPRRVCESEARSRCSAVVADAEQIAIAYVPVCTVERATVADLQSRVDREVAGTPEAKELTWLVETLKACAAARSAGLTWEFHEPASPYRCVAKKPPEQSQDLQALLPAAPLPQSRVADRKKVPEKLLTGRTKPGTWEKTGWNVFRWGMGPADVRQRLQDKTGNFQAFEAPDCEFSAGAEAQFSYSCYLSSSQHVFRVGAMAPSLFFGFMDGKLWEVSVYFRSTSRQAVRQTFETFQGLLSKEYGDPDPSSWASPQPKDLKSEEPWFSFMDWSTTSAKIKLMGTATADRHTVDISYQCPKASAVYFKRVQEIGRKTGSSTNTGGGAKRAKPQRPNPSI
jgi:hypothetical protein